MILIFAPTGCGAWRPVPLRRGDQGTTVRSKKDCRSAARVTGGERRIMRVDCKVGLKKWKL